jgi:REP element-mobilizing transposase RayT
MSGEHWPQRVPSIRIGDRDYAQAGVYFVTTCAHRREQIFGRVVEGNMVLNEFGQCVDEAWLALPRRFPQVVLGTHVIMPDHMHGIITFTTQHLTSIRRVGARSSRPLKDPAAKNPTSHAKPLPPGAHPDDSGLTNAFTLGHVVAYFKYQATCAINAKRNGGTQRVFQRGYFERIVRDNRQWTATDFYILANPEKYAA